jgi:protoporphyrinogen oxidase
MEPYNFKVWGTPLELMDKGWIAERVSVVDLARIERNIADQRDDLSWGPNNTFRFPKHGGTGAIYEGIAEPFRDKIVLGHEMNSVDFERRQVTFSTGLVEPYDILINTSPLDRLVQFAVSAPDSVRDAAANLVHNSGLIVGLGFEGRRDDSKCWMYFPENNSPFYRVTNFYNYSRFNVPEGDAERYSSLMCETTYSSHKQQNAATIIDETEQGLINSGMIGKNERNRLISRYLIDIPYSYPVPTLERDRALSAIQPYLEARSVYSRGRFGAWKYEVGNMDHSFMQGVELVERLINGVEERTVNGSAG